MKEFMGWFMEKNKNPVESCNVMSMDEHLGGTGQKQDSEGTVELRWLH